MNIIESIYSEPEKWRPTKHYLIHENDAKLCISNGIFFCQPEGGSFNLANKWRAWRAYRWWCINAPVSAYGTNIPAKRIKESD